MTTSELKDNGTDVCMILYGCTGQRMGAVGVGLSASEGIHLYVVYTGT